MMLDNKTILITGGTGSFGISVLTRLLDSNVSKVIIFSRDEKKQEDLRLRIKDPRVRFFIGDVRDFASVNSAMLSVDFVFHAAALKQVPSCEFFPLEALKTNVLGTEHVLSAAVANNVKKVVCLSTDKAVYPINAMGMTKALMEKVMVAFSRTHVVSDTIICGTRYGNVMASRGSVIPLFAEQVTSGSPLTVTDSSMTRFMMSLSDAVELVLYAFENGCNGDIFVQKSPAATVEIIAKSVAHVMGRPDHPIHYIGSRHGEKLYESLVSCEELARAEDLGRYFRIPPDNRELDYSAYVNEGTERLTASLHGESYNSHNTDQLDLSTLINLIRDNRLIQEALLD